MYPRAMPYKSEVARDFFGGPVVTICLPRQETQEMWVNPWVRKIPWSRKWQSTLVSLSGKSQGQRSLVGYGPCGSEELDATEHTHYKMLMLKRKAYKLLEREKQQAYVRTKMSTTSSLKTQKNATKAPKGKHWT